jgi:hypothetical protein
MHGKGGEGHGDRGQRSEECEVVGIRECVVASTAHVLVSLDYCQVCVHVCGYVCECVSERVCVCACVRVCVCACVRAIYMIYI